MFKKLLSNLPFNPSLVTQVSFYAKRIKNESAVRRLGLGFMGMAMVVQVFAVISPPESTLAESSNDVIRGGFASRDEAVNHCRNDTQGFRDVLAYYQLDCTMLSTAETLWIKSTAHNRLLDSMGRNPQPATNPRNGKPSDQYVVQIGGTTFYMKNLWYWDTYDSSSYKVLKVLNKNGQVIYIMYDCGNIVTIDRYTPPQPEPEPEPEPEPVPQQEPEPEPEPEDVCPNKDGVQTTEEECDVCPNRPGIQYTLEECDVCPNIPGTQSSADECYPCPEAENSDEEMVCLDFNKTARNDTQDVADANGTMAAAGDTIVYTLSVKNTGVVEFKDFIVEENLADVLEYSEIVDLDGGTYDEDTNIATWPKVDIPSNQTITRTITVKVLDPIPQSPVSKSNPGTGDLQMTNVFYDKSVNIELPPAIHKQIERVNTTLPETGPGESLVAGFLLTSFIGYFFARSRQMSEELIIVKEEFGAGA